MTIHNMLSPNEGKFIFPEEEKNHFVTSFNIITCLKQIKLQRMLLTCAPISELPSHISTMISPIDIVDRQHWQHGPRFNQIQEFHLKKISM